MIWNPKRLDFLTLGLTTTATSPHKMTIQMSKMEKNTYLFCHFVLIFRIQSLHHFAFINLPHWIHVCTDRCSALEKKVTSVVSVSSLHQLHFQLLNVSVGPQLACFHSESCSSSESEERVQHWSSGLFMLLLVIKKAFFLIVVVQKVGLKTSPQCRCQEVGQLVHLPTENYGSHTQASQSGIPAWLPGNRCGFPHSYFRESLFSKPGPFVCQGWWSGSCNPDELVGAQVNYWNISNTVYLSGLWKMNQNLLFSPEVHNSPLYWFITCSKWM